MSWTLRLARENDISALEELIPLSVRSLQAPYYSRTQIEAALGPVFGIDRRLIIDGTFLVAVHQEQLVGCGGWSKRRSLFGSDQGRNPADDSALDPEREPARIRAFFVHPAWARRGIGRALLADCETAIRDAGFHSAELVATLAGEPLYASCAYTVVERYEIPLDNGSGLPVVRMARRLTEPSGTVQPESFHRNRPQAAPRRL